MTLPKVAVYAIGAVGVVVLVCLLVFFLLPDTYNGYVKNQVVKAFTTAYPAYSIRIAGVHCNLREGRIGCDRIALTSIDSAFSCSIAELSVSGIAWSQVLRHGDLASKVLSGSVADAREIVLTLRRLQYELRCKRLRVSLPDSEISADALELHPLLFDDEFFSSSKFRRTRFRVTLPQCGVTGADCRGLLQGKAYAARLIKVSDAFFDVLVNKDTPYNRNSSRPLMPSEALSSIGKTTRVKSLNITNGRLKYAERYTIGSPPAEVVFDSIRLSAEGIANHAAPGATAIIRGQGTFMKSSTMKIRMDIPVISPDMPLRYSGSLNVMDMTGLNSFLEIGEGMRIKSGILQNATFDINIVAGRASGTVQASYKDLNIAFLNKLTGSEKGAVDRVASFMTNAMKIRGSNMPDKSGSTKTGEVKYTRQQDDTFLELVWFSLRSGIGDVVGF